MVDSSCHVPLMIHVPGHGHERRQDPCSLVDIAPTLLRYVGAPYDPREFDGWTCLPPLNGHMYTPSMAAAPAERI